MQASLQCPEFGQEDQELTRLMKTSPKKNDTDLIDRLDHSLIFILFLLAYRIMLMYLLILY